MLGNDNDKIFLTIQNGKIVRRVKAGTPDAVERINKKNEAVHELLYSFITGRIENIFIQENDYGKNWCIVLIDGKEKYQLSIPYSSGYSKGFLFRIEVCDLTKEIMFKPYAIEDKGKTKTFLVLYNKNVMGGWDKLEAFYSKENPGKLPPMTKVKYKGEERWDDTDQMLYFENIIFNKVLPKLKADPFTEAAHEEVKRQVTQEGVNEEEPDFFAGYENV